MILSPPMLPVHSESAMILQMLLHNASDNEIHNTLHILFSTTATIKLAIEASGDPQYTEIIRAQTTTNSWLSGNILSPTIAAEIISPIS
jgi:arginine decarboxylase-like protein